MADTEALPSADEFFGQSQGGQLPTADEFFAPSPMQRTGTVLGHPLSGEAWDGFFTHTAVGRVMDAFGQGAKDGWGTGQPSWSEDAQTFLKKSGMLDTLDQSHSELTKAFNEALVRPTATLLYNTARTAYEGGEIVMKGLSAGFQGGAEAAAQTAKELPSTGPLSVLQTAAGGTSEILGAPEALIGMPHGGAPHIAEEAPAPRPRVEPTLDIPRARSLNVIGPGGEAAWKGEVEAPPLSDADRADALKSQIAEQEAQPERSGAVPTQDVGVQPGADAAPPSDIHQVARQIDPETFRQYDALVARQDTYRRWIDELGQGVSDRQAETKQRAAALDEQADQLRAQADQAVSAKKKAALADQVAAAERQRDDLLEQADKMTTSGDIAKVRADLAKNDYAMRDLAPQVSAAYREAQSRMPPEPGVSTETAAPEAVPSQGAEAVPVPQSVESVAPAAVIAAETAPEVPVPAEAVTPATGPEAPKVSIAKDVATRLIDVGRPKEEAWAAASLIDAHYKARAARFDGAKGTAEDLYKAEAPLIKAGRQTKARVKEMAQKGEFEQAGAKGKVKFIDQARPILTLMKDADASTFVHETGHVWLEELMRDAVDEKAPEELKADAAAVRKWLGAEEGAEIKRAQHEKFARGFETYMMEGRAPSVGLARVFEQFKNWLTTIYKTVAALKSPISDDIRGVFDRMLSAEPNHPVIAADRESPSTLASIHEAEADSTPPEHAEEVADRIRAEADAVAIAQVPEIADELGIERPAETGPGAGQNAEADRHGTEGQPEPGGAGGSARPGEIVPGGNETAREGAEPAGAGRTGEHGSGKVAPSPEPGSPNEPFERPDSRFVDKAGNFRMENINTSEEVKQAIRDSVNRNGEFEDARRGVVSDAEAFRLADVMGMKPSDLDRRSIGDAFNKEQIIGLERLFIKAATDVKNAARMAQESLSDEALMAYGETEARQKMILDTIAGHASGVRAEAGRALQAYNALKKMEGHLEAHAVADVLKESTGTTLYQLKQRAAAIANLQTPAKVAGALNEMRKPGLGAMALEIFKNWLISGPITHSTYLIGNELLALYKAVPETAFEVGVGAIREAITGERNSRAHIGEVRSQLYAMFKGQRDGVKAAWDSFKSGQTMALPHEILDSATKAERVKYDALRAQGVTHEDAVKQLGGDPGARTPFTNSAAVPNFKVLGVPAPLGSAVRAPGERMVAPIHSYHRTIGYLQSIARQSYRIAHDEGLDGNALRTRIANLTRTPTEEMMTTARHEATEQTLMGKGGELTKRVSAVINWEPKLPFIGPTKPLAFIDPFVHVASNVMEQSVMERGPLGLMTERLRDDVRGRNGTAAQDKAIARMALGTTLTAVGMGMAMEGLITPSAPSDPKEAAMWRRVNGAPHSLRVGDHAIDLSRLGVLGFMMGISADLYHAMSRIGEDDFSTIGSLLAHSFVQNFMDEGFMRGPSDMIKAVDEPDRYGSEYMRNLISSFAVPYSIGMSQVARQVDPYARVARTLMDEIKSKVPWWSETLVPRVDIWGQPVRNREWAGVYDAQVSNDPVDQALMKLGYYPSMPERKIVGIELTDEQYHEYATIAGRLAKMYLDAVVRAPGFSENTSGVQLEVIQDRIKSARDKARELMKMQSFDSDNNIVEKALQNKLDLLRKQ